MKRIAVVGAGIMGQILSLYLRRNDFNVTLFFNHRKKGASSIAAGMISPFSEINHSDIDYDLFLKSISEWKGISKLFLSNRIFAQTGTHLIAHRQDLNDLKHHQVLINRKFNKKFIIKDFKIGDTDFNEIYFPEESQVYVGNFFKCMRKKILELGVHMIDQHVIQIKNHHIKTKLRDHHFDYVFDCRGAEAKNINGLRKVRGEILRVRAKNVAITEPIRLLHPHYPIYIVPQMNNVYIIGASHIESQCKNRISVITTLELLNAAMSVHKGFAEGEILKYQTDFRPAFFDHQPQIILNRDCLHINGLFRQGFLYAPVIADDIVRFLQDKNFHHLHHFCRSLN